MTQYGSEVAPQAPQQDMWAYDNIATTGATEIGDRTNSPGEFTGGTGGSGLGGMAETQDGPDRYERIGF